MRAGRRSEDRLHPPSHTQDARTRVLCVCLSLPPSQSLSHTHPPSHTQDARTQCTSTHPPMSRAGTCVCVCVRVPPAGGGGQGGRRSEDPPTPSITHTRRAHIMCIYMRIICIMRTQCICAHQMLCARTMLVPLHIQDARTQCTSTHPPTPSRMYTRRYQGRVRTHSLNKYLK
jgi:hypothetical protein